MNHYEILAIITSTLADTEVPSAITKVEETLKKYECTLHYSQNLERRKLAYPIAHQQYGSYVLIEFDCDPGHIGKLENDFRLTPELLRHVIVRRSSVGKPRAFFKEAELSFGAEKRPVRKETKAVSLDEALQTVEQETKEAQKSPTPVQETAAQPLREELVATQPSKDSKPPLTDEDLEKQLNDKLAEILRDGI